MKKTQYSPPATLRVAMRAGNTPPLRLPNYNRFRWPNRRGPGGTKCPASGRNDFICHCPAEFPGRAAEVD
jgi:hypothetical protein